MVSGAPQSVFSGSSGPVVTSQSVPGPCSLGGKETGSFLAPTPSCGNPSPHWLFWGLWASWAPCWSGLDLFSSPPLLSELTLKVYMRPSPQEVRGLPQSRPVLFPSPPAVLLPLSPSRNSSLWPCSYLGPSRQNPRVSMRAPWADRWGQVALPDASILVPEAGVTSRSPNATPVKDRESWRDLASWSPELLN